MSDWNLSVREARDGNFRGDSEFSDEIFIACPGKEAVS